MKIVLTLMLIIGSFGSTLSSQKKTTVALLDLQISSDLSQNISFALSNLIREEFLYNPYYQILDRNNMTTILKEQDFSLSEACNSKECAVEVGKLLGVEKILYGSIGTLGKKFLINLQMMDVTTGEIDKIENQSHVGAIEDLDVVVRNVAKKLMGKESTAAPEKDYAIYVSSEPEGASVYVNDIARGNTPINLEFADDRMIRITLKAQDYQEWFRELSPKKGDKMIINATLLQKKAESSGGDIILRRSEYERRKKSPWEAATRSIFLGAIGAGHYYAGSPIKGTLILGSTVFVIATMPSTVDDTFLSLILISAWFYDIIDSQLDLDKYNTKLKKDLNISFVPDSRKGGRLMLSMNF